MTKQNASTSDSATTESGDYADQMGPVFRVTRFTIFLAIIGTALSAIAMMGYALLVVIHVIREAFGDRPYTLEHAKHLAIELIELTDFFLFGMALYVVAVGMVQLFIRPIPGLPEWMEVRDLGDLKTQLLNVIVVLLAVSFLAMAISWTGGRDIIYLGIGIGIVILSLAAYNMAHHAINTRKH